MTFIPQMGPNGKLVIEYRRQIPPKQPVPPKKIGVWQVESFADPYLHYDDSDKWFRLLYEPEPPTVDFEFE